MNEQENVIHLIFDTAYLDNEFEGIQPLRSNDLQNEYEKLNDFEKQHGISEAVHLDFDEVLTKFIYASELKGFTNGFKLAVRLFVGK